MNSLVSIRPIHTAGLYEAARKAARQDNHEAPYPTHVLEKDQEIVGAIGIRSLPLVTWWLHSEKTNVRDTLMTGTVIESLLAQDANLREYFMLCTKISPYHEVMNRLGFARLEGDFDLFQKGL